MSDKTFKREQVVEIVGSVINRVSATYPIDHSLFNEVRDLKSAIDKIRDDLSLTHPDTIQSHIPNATDELGAIVTATEDATHIIMTACEAIQQIIAEKPAAESSAIENHLTRIIEACTFQDLTGQRITKIVKSLTEIDNHAGALSRILSERFAILENKTVKQTAESGSLMNGPQLPGGGITQEEIDKLLNDF